jgi:hypothetical protein
MIKYIAGIIMIAIGVSLVVKTEWYLSFWGRIAWAEEKFGGDGTRTFFKLLGIATIFLAFMIMSGQIITALDWIFKR